MSNSPPAGCERTEKYGRSVSYALRRLDEETPFSKFFPRSSFSALKFGLSTYTDDQYVTQSAVCPSSLFTFGARPEHSEALKFIHCSRSHPWPVLPPERKKTEREVMLSITSSPYAGKWSWRRGTGGPLRRDQCLGWSLATSGWGLCIRGMAPQMRE